MQFPRPPLTTAHRRGFTLLELLVVVAIIAVLVSYVGPKYFGQVSKSQIQAARAQLDSFAKSIDAYRLDVGRFPTTEQSLGALTTRPANETKWSGPYLQAAAPTDPWGNVYGYRSPSSSGGDYEIWSMGADGQLGGEGSNADIVLAR